MAACRKKKQSENLGELIASYLLGSFSSARRLLWEKRNQYSYPDMSPINYDLPDKPLAYHIGGTPHEKESILGTGNLLKSPHLSWVIDPGRKPKSVVQLN